MMQFRYHPDVLARFPDLCGGVILARGLTGGPSPDALRADFAREQSEVLARLGSVPLSDLASLAGWRAAFRAFGVDPTQYRSAAEALLRRLTKKGDIPSINTLVDIGNLVSIRYGLPVAIFDVRALQGEVTVRFARGDERFLPLGETAPESPAAGEVIFSDPTGRVIARRWCWRQSDDSAARGSTREAIITVEAQHAGGQADVEAAGRELLALLARYAGGTFVSFIPLADAVARLD